MKVAIDLTALLPEATGVDNYLRQLVVHLGQMDRDNRFTIFTNYEDRRIFGGLLPDNFTVATGSWRPRPVRLFFQQLMLPAIALLKDVDVIHSPSFIMPLYKGRPRHLLTIHDMTFFSLPDYHTALRRSSFYRHAVLHSIRRADAINAPSNATKQQIIELVPEIKPERVRVINWGIGSEFHPIESEEIEALLTCLNLPRPYILYVGTIEPRKNLARLIESYRRILASTRIPEHLVLVGKLGWGYDSILRQIDDPELRGKVHLKGYVDQRDLPGLYCGARLFVYPSLYEGFGFPPLEAMACGVPVIASSSSALAENLDGAAELVSPTDVEALVEAMRRLLFNQPLRAIRQTQGLQRADKFRWKEAARKTLECYRELAASRSSAST